MASNDRTIVSEKTKFLRRQTRILSENVVPSSRSIEKATKAGIPEPVVRDVIQKGKSTFVGVTIFILFRCFLRSPRRVATFQ